MAEKEASASDKPTTKQTCLGCLALLGIVVLVIGILTAVCGPVSVPRESSRSPSPASEHERLLKVETGRPTIWVAIEQKLSHSKLRRIAHRMRDRWRDAQGSFAAATGRGSEWSKQQLRFATTFVFFCLPGMNLERDAAWARVDIPPKSQTTAKIISPGH